jgi:hypothetical protein
VSEGRGLVKVAGRQTARRKTKASPQGAPRGGRGRQPVGTTGFWPGQQGYAIIPWWNPLHWNWRRGLVRLWLLASLLWAGYWLYKLQLTCAFWFAPWCEAPAHVDWPNGNMALGLAMVLLSGPLLMLAMWWVVLWVIRGLLARRAR